ncbi:MAG TPA: hypothetical protein VN493_31460 [Thermoanaerobaculia bacterium]|nr:hypothetical protein [Thermoanaerobaculia bacterium]
MRSRNDGNTLPNNAFAEEYLALLNERDEPITAPEADYAGPWSVEARRQGGHAVLRVGENLDRGDEPYAVFEALEISQMAAAVLPGTGREKRYRLGKDEEAGRGYPVFRAGEIVGHVKLFDEDFVAALNVLDALLATPYDFAWLLEAAGGLALQHVGRISMARATGTLR